MISQKKGINSVIKSLNILECFSREVKELKLTEISKMLNMPKSTTSNLIYTLESMGYIEKNIKNGKFRLGIKLFTLGKTFEYHLSIVELAKPYMEILRNKINETVHLSILYGTEVICIEKIEGLSAIGMSSQVGKKLPLHCTASGKLFLSAMSQELLKKILDSINLVQYTNVTITEVNVLYKEIEVIKERGYSLAIEEGEVGLTSIAAPIYNYNCETIASISLAGPSVRLSGSSMKKAIQELLKASKFISEKLGYS